MIAPTATAVWKAATLALVAIVTYVTLSLALTVHRMHDAQAAQARAALDAVNARARAETTRVVLSDSVRRVVDRAAVQLAQRPDAVDRAIGGQRVAIDSLRAVIAGLHVTGARSSGNVTLVTPPRLPGDTMTLRAPTTPADSGSAMVRRATFDVRQAPYTAHAVVELPAAGRGSIDLSVQLDTLALTVRASCGDVDANGVRPARVAVAGPPWAVVQLARVEQDPDVCRSPALEHAKGIAAARSDRRVRLALVAGYGYTFAASTRTAEPRGFVGVALALPVPLPRWLPLH